VRRASRGGYVAPSDDGTTLFTPFGFIGPDMKPAPDDRFGPQRSHPVPAPGTPFFIGVDCSRVREERRVGVSLHWTEDRSRVMDVPALRRMPLEWASTGGIVGEGPISLDERFHLRLSTGKLVVIPETGARLLVVPVDPLAAMKAAGKDYLFVAGFPEPAARGKPYSYQLDVRSSRGGVRCRLESGPPGLTVTEAGLLRWNVPQRPPAVPPTVMVNVRDAGGAETRKAVKVGVR
jgi:hypothetical protein